MPVNPDTVDKWVHAPYSGHFDGERIWGRGTADDKNSLIAILSVSSFVSAFVRPDNSDRTAVEYLVSADFEPARTLVLAFGFDEESSGMEVCAITPLYFNHYKIEIHRVLGPCLSIYWLLMVKTRSR